MLGRRLGIVLTFECALASWNAVGASEEDIASRTQWVEALRAGMDPAVVFDAATLERLRSE